MEQSALFTKGKSKIRPERAGKLNAGERSLKELRKRGYLAEVCEKYIARVAGPGQAAKFSGGFRKDLFGFMDIIAFHPSIPGVVAVQTTSRNQMVPHMRKYRTDPETKAAILEWLKDRTRHFVIHGWEPVEVANRGKAGAGKTHVEWRLTEMRITAGDLA